MGNSLVTSVIEFFRTFLGVRVDPYRFRFTQQERQPVSPAEVVYTIARRRNISYQLLFIGEGGSGKSTAIANLFTGKSDKNPVSKTKDKAFQVWKLSSPGEDETSESKGVSLHILEVPGLQGKNSVEDDAKITTASNSLFKQELRSRIPTITFIVARMDDNRFEGEQSNFTKVLRACTYMRSYITDKTCSNVILLLTHSDKPDVQGNSDTIIHHYQTAFRKVFPTSLPIPCIKLHRNSEFHHLIGEVSLIVSRRRKREFSLLYAFVNDISLRSKFSEGFTLNKMPVEDLVPRRRALITKIMNKMMSGEIADDRPEHSDSDDEGRTSGNYYVYFCPHSWLNAQFKLARNRSLRLVRFTCLRPDSKLMLGDKTFITVADCLVGDRVLGFQSRIGVVTKVTMIRAPHDLWLREKVVGVAYCKASDGNETGAESFVYVYQHGAYRIVNARQIDRETEPCETLYYIEVDNGEGSFVVDGYVCVSKTK